MASITFDFVCQLGVLDVCDQLVEIDLVSTAGFQQRAGVEDALVALRRSSVSRYEIDHDDQSSVLTLTSSWPARHSLNDSITLPT
jgi:hypothetical protein